MTSLTSLRSSSRLSLASTDLGATHQPQYRPFACTSALFGADLLAVVLGLSCTAVVTSRLDRWLGSGAAPFSPDLPILMAAIVFYLAVQGRYSERLTFWSELRLVVYATLGAIGMEAALGMAADGLLTRAPAVAGLITFAAAATVLNRLAKSFLNRAGVWGLPILIIGDGPGAATAEAALTADHLLGYRCVARISPNVVLAPAARPSIQRVLNQYGAARMLLAIDTSGDLQRRVIECALRERVPFALVPQPQGSPAFAFQPVSFLGQDSIFLSYRDGLSRPLARTVKALIDVAAAALLLVVCSGLFLILAVASRLDGGPVLFAHRRVGAGGRPFNCLKFRTMVVDADRVLEEALARDPALAAEWAASRKLTNDPRVTRVGRILRKTSLDELPQLLNILRLDMSLVGPRPIVDSEVPLYGESIAQYYATRPGLTGLWQVSGRSNTSYARRVQLDVWYVNNWTIWNDIVVLLKTIPVVLYGQGAH